jgi:hypothetical protein
LALTPLSNTQLGLHTTFDSIAALVVIQSRLSPLLGKLIHLLRCPSYETLRVEEGVEVPLDRVEVRISLDALNTIVLEAEPLDLVGSFMRQRMQNGLTSSHSVAVASRLGTGNEPCHTYPDSLVCDLSISALLFAIAMMTFSVAMDGNF